MASVLQKVMGVAESVKETVTETPKQKDLAKNTVDGDDKNAHLTSDTGLKISNTEDWLSVASKERAG